jgi:hypothetical protein
MAKQQEIPGTESPKIKEIEVAAEAYVDVRDKRMRLTEKEVTAKTNLIQVVQDHAKELSADKDGRPCYRFDDLIVILKPGKTNVKVRHFDADPEEGDDD